MSKHKVTEVQRQLLDILLGLEPMDRNDLAVTAGMDPSGAFARHLASLRNDGLVEYPRQGVVALTSTSRSWLNGIVADEGGTESNDE